ncbi:uncharacterized protein IL334_005158 [Kwoniella shivajii]|uniref:ferric-chelate reductase (NADPH) n=1 Tax=Kwoniella shivajii TaxID=564305 RepID=A0ABZ1D2D6_9TREE|nr:hypothetical protein IL334_005158 [Kwoniella shivajii]
MIFHTILSIVSLSLLISPSYAANLDLSVHIPSYDCVYGCYNALSVVTFKDIKSKKAAIADQCNSTMFGTSLVLCSETYCQSQQQEAGWDYMTTTCKKSKVKLPAYTTLLGQINRSEVVDVDTIEQQKKTFNGTILVDQHSFNIGYRTLVADASNRIYSHSFGWTVYLFMGVAVMIGLINRLISLYVHRYVTSSPEATSPPATTSRRSALSKVYTLWRRHVTTPALFGYKHSQPWGWVSIPTRLQGILIFAYIAVNIIFMLVGYDVFEENLDSPGDIQTQICDLGQYRTGVMCIYNLPLLWMLAGRNDVILWLTGWSYASLNLWHRWIARLAVLQAFIHGVMYTIMKRDDLYERFFHRMYWATGIFALICFCLMVVLSIKPIRTRWYELFLIVHIALALCSLVLLYFHLTHMKGAFNPYIWACAAVWCLDRVIRVLRVVVLTFKALSKRGKNTLAVMSNSDSGLIRLSITTSIRITPQPGQYYFLYHPFSVKPWENHPFTVASWEIADKSTTLHFLVAPQKGVTKRWRKRVSKKEDRTDNIRLLLEGPYGHANPIEAYEKVLLVAGGSGITSMLAYLHTLRHHIKDLSHVRTKEVTLVWVIKDMAYASDVLDHELKDFSNGSQILNGISFKVQLHVTRDRHASPRTLVGSQLSDNGSSQSLSSDETKTSPESSPATDTNGTFSEKQKGKEGSLNKSGVSFHSSRPEMKDLLNSAVLDLVGGERLAVSACGPAKLTDDMRKAVCGIYGSEEGKVDGNTVEYFEELFCW